MRAKPRAAQPVQAGEKMRSCLFCTHLRLHPCPARHGDAGAHWGWALALPASCTRLADVSCLLELRGSSYRAGSSCCCQAEALGEAFLDSSEWEPGALATGETPRGQETEQRQLQLHAGAVGLARRPQPSSSRVAFFLLLLLAISLSCLRGGTVEYRRSDKFG